MVPGAEYLCVGNKQVFKDFLSSWELTPGNNLGSEPFFKNTAGLALKTLWGSDIIYPNTNSLKITTLLDLVWMGKGDSCENSLLQLAVNQRDTKTMED